MKQEWIRSLKKKTRIQKNILIYSNFTFRFDRPRKVLIINDESPDWFVTIKENLDDNWEKKFSISLFSPPHIKQRRIRRSNCFLFGRISSIDRSCSTDNLSCSMVNSLTMLSTIGIAKKRNSFSLNIDWYLLSILIWNCFWVIKSSRISRPLGETIKQP